MLALKIKRGRGGGRIGFIKDPTAFFPLFSQIKRFQITKGGRAALLAQLPGR